MKVLMLNGSSHINGTTMAALTEVGKALEEDGIEYEIFQIGGGPVADCLGCGQCTESGWIHIRYAGLLCASKWTDPVVLRPGILQQR